MRAWLFNAGELEEGTELLAVVGALQEFAAEEEMRLDHDHREKWKPWHYFAEVLPP